MHAVRTQCPRSAHTVQQLSLSKFLAVNAHELGLRWCGHMLSEVHKSIVSLGGCLGSSLPILASSSIVLLPQVSMYFACVVA